MAVNEEILTGRKFRKCIDEINKIWQRYSFWGKASDTEFDDGKDAETKVGAIDGITDSLVSTSSRIAASAKAVSTLNNNLAQQPEWIKDSTGKITGYKTPGGADTVFPFMDNKFYQYTLTAGQIFPNIIVQNGETYYFVGIIGMDIIKNNVGSYSPAYFSTGCKIEKTSSGYSVSLTTLNESSPVNYYGGITAIYMLGSMPQIVDFPS